MSADSTAAWTPAEREAFAAKRRSRNLALGIVLVLLVVLFFGITVAKMQPGLRNEAATSTTAAPPANDPALLK
jgi:hypothetical protein